MLPLCLASASSGRLSTLCAAGVVPLVRVSTVDEPTVLEDLARSRAQAGLPRPTPAEQVQALAAAKAREVASRTGAHEACAVLGCDSMLQVGEEVIGKPLTARRARERWAALRGRRATLHTGHTLIRTDDGRERHEVSSTVVRFASPSEAEIEAYVATGEPLGCAGGFTLDGLGGAFVEGVEGDPHGVVGVSLPLLRLLLADLGVVWTSLWEVPVRDLPGEGPRP